MKLKIALIFILIILITVLTFGAVVNADEYIIKPEKVNYYDSIYSATPGGSSFFDPDKTYNSFFSPYATSEVKVETDLSVSFTLWYDCSYISPSITTSQINRLKSDLEDSFYLYRHKGDGNYSFSVNCSSVDISQSVNNRFSANFSLKYHSTLKLTSGSLGFYNVSNYDIIGPEFIIGYSSISDYSYLRSAKLFQVYFSHVKISSVYSLPIICTANNLLFLYKFSIFGFDTGYNPSGDLISNLYINNVFVDSRNTHNLVGGVYDLNYDNPLSNSVFNISINSSGTLFYTSSQNEPIMMFFEFGTLIPYSEDVGYSGGQNFGSWSSNSCDWYDIPCHLGNALGYLVYEFPLTKPITTLFSGLVGYLDAFFDISSEFSGVEVIYGVLITMIVVGIVVALFKG